MVGVAPPLSTMGQQMQHSGYVGSVFFFEYASIRKVKSPLAEYYTDSRPLVWQDPRGFYTGFETQSLLTTVRRIDRP